jgi:hypothetical protein
MTILTFNPQKQTENAFVPERKIKSIPQKETENAFVPQRKRKR